MTQHPDALRRAAKRLRRAFEAGNLDAKARFETVLPPSDSYKHADALHVVAREAGFASWPKLVFTHETATADVEANAAALRRALYFGQHWRVTALLQDRPDLARHSLAIAAALYDVDFVRAHLAAHPEAIRERTNGRTPFVFFCFSQHLHGGGEEEAMLATAAALVEAGASVEETARDEPGSDYEIGVLYGALGHANNIALARWLLEHGADPNDNESLYHATELGHHEGLRLLIEYGVDPAGTNALPRALDFEDPEMVRLLIEAAGADPNEGIAPHPSGEAPVGIPALHQAARRLRSREIADLLLSHGADPNLRYRGSTAYALARVHGNAGVAQAIADAGGDTALSPIEQKLAAAADGSIAPDDWIDMAKLTDELQRLLCRIVSRPGAIAQIERLLALGFDPNVGDEMDLTPLHVAGWEGLSETVALLLRNQPDLGHVNAYGGTFFSTILHGSENCPARAERDHLGCMRLALEEGVAIPRRALELAGDEEMAAFLGDWAEAHPGAVVGDGVA